MAVDRSGPPVSDFAVEPPTRGEVAELLRERDGYFGELYVGRGWADRSGGAVRNAPAPSLAHPAFCSPLLADLTPPGRSST